MKTPNFFQVTVTILTALIVGAAIFAYGPPVTGQDECAEQLSKYNRFAAGAAEIDADLRRPRDREYMEMGRRARLQIDTEMEMILKNMRSLGCTNMPGQPGSGSAVDDRTGRPMHVPDTEDSCEYTESPEPRYLNPKAFIERVQPPNSEAPGTCGDLSGRWQITTSEGTQTWEVWHTEMAPRFYGGRKVSQGDDAKMLAALLDGNILKFQFDSWANKEKVIGGTYTCKLNAGCQSSLSDCRLTYDRNRRGSLDATFKWLGPRRN